eukprot:10371482-Ditylum_brightwellii.AAC.1
MQMTENNADKKKVAISETADKKKVAKTVTADKKKAAKYECYFDINELVFNCMLTFYFCVVKFLDGLEEVQEHVRDEAVPDAFKMDNKSLKKKACVSMEKKTPAPSPGGRKVCKKLVQNKIESSTLAKTPLPKKKHAPLPVARGKPPPSPVARGKPPPSSAARSGCNKPGLNNRCRKSPNDSLVKQIQRDSERMRGNW